MDYWHEGWAQYQPEIPPEENQREYNGWNALADIIGAYWKKQSDGGTNSFDGVGLANLPIFNKTGIFF